MGWATRMVPPDLEDVLVKYLPEGTEWYEVRNSLSVCPFRMDEQEQAYKTVSALRRIVKSTTLFYCWKQDGSIEEREVSLPD